MTQPREERVTEPRVVTPEEAPDRIAEAERRGAVKALRRVALTFASRDDQREMREWADAIENGAPL